MNIIEKIAGTLIDITTWKQMFITLIALASFVTLYTLWENRQDIYNTTVKIPTSQVYYVQKDLEILEILRELNDKVGSMRSYIVEYRPEWDDDDNLSDVDMFGIYEQVEEGVSGVTESIQEKPLIDLPMNWAEVFREGIIICSERVDDNMSPYLRHLLEKEGVASRVYIGMYTKEGKMKYGLVVDFGHGEVVNENTIFVIQEYRRILRYYLK